MNEFLKYLKMIPVIIYPYIYVLILAIFLLFAGILPEDYTDVALIGLLIVAVIYNLYSFIIVIVNAVQAAKGIMTARQAARRATNSVGCGLRSSGHLVIARSVRLSVFQIRSTAKQMLRFISSLPV